jgi:acyl carrier protein
MPDNSIHERVVRVIGRSARAKSAAAGWQDSLNLLEAGILDSLGFVAVLTGLQAEFGVEIDLVDSDPDVFMTLGGLVQLVTAALEREAGGTRAAA